MKKKVKNKVEGHSLVVKKDEKKYRMKGYELAESNLYESKMSEFHMLVKEGKSAQQIARIMKIDLKTVKVLMKGMKESVQLDEISVQTRRKMARSAKRTAKLRARKRKLKEI